MKISKAELIKMHACADGLERFIEQTNNTDEPVEVSSLVGGYVTYLDLLWLADKTVDKSKIIRFACDCALINIELIKPYTDKYDTIVNFLNNPTAAYAAAAANAYNAASNAYNAAARAARAATAYAHVAANANAAAYAARAAVNAVNAYNAAFVAITSDTYAARAASHAVNAVDNADANVNELLIKLFED